MDFRLGEDLGLEDNIMDGFTFEDIILQVHCNCRKINEESVRQEIKELVLLRMEDMTELLDRNIDVIMKEAMKGREV
nr:MAG TPA: hypothetical protein [Caudoviricetes sp.]